MSKLLVVIGATGAQGGAVIDFFLKQGNAYRLRGITRRPSSEATLALARKGVEVVQADLEDVESLKRAFAGADAIFAYTNFVEGVRSPEAQQILQAGKAATLGQAAAVIEQRQGKNVADAAATVSQLKRLVWSSLPHVSKWSNGKYTNVTHFDSKAIILNYMRGLPELDGKVSVLHLGSFADNVVRLPEAFSFKKQPDGSYVYSLPMSGKVPTPFIDIENDAGAFVSALLEAPAGYEVLGVSEYLSTDEWLALWSSHNGVTARFEITPAQPLLDDDPVGMNRQMLEVFQFIEEFGFDGGDPACLTPDKFEQLTGVKIPRTRIADHIKRFDWSPVL